MVQIPAFEVEQWMDAYENTPGVLNIAETCARSISLSELTSFHRDSPTSATGIEAASLSSIVDVTRPLTYGAIRGSAELRRNIAALYAEDAFKGEGSANAESNSEGKGEDKGESKGEKAVVSPDDIIVTQGAIAANHLVFYALVGPGDHVVCVFPAYQQLYEVPRTLGAEVSLWRLRAENGYVPDVGELEGLVRSNTKMIVINNPNNPTGAPIPRSVLEQIIAIARRHNIIVLSDEVYRPLFHSIPPTCIPPSALNLGYSRVIATSSMSKSWALAGIRIGWAASLSPSLISSLASARDYTTISVSQLDDSVARYALSPAVFPSLLARNIALAKTNLSLLSDFVDRYKGKGKGGCEWVKPTAGTTAFIKFTKKDGTEVDDEGFCKDVLRKTGVMFLPGARCFGHGEEFKGFVRIGYVGDTEVLREALRRLGRYVDENIK
ncbi:PLP-dependent transferase [Nemania sp. FL0916]|nr:PLP-dependent transferase [Nemania sp. FL0916]